MSENKVHRIPRIKRECPSVYSYRAELLYGRRFVKKLRESKDLKELDSAIDTLNPDYAVIKTLGVVYGQRCGKYKEVRDRIKRLPSTLNLM